jgi:hypothetical protein
MFNLCLSIFKVCVGHSETRPWEGHCDEPGDRVNSGYRYLA